MPDNLGTTLHSVESGAKRNDRYAPPATDMVFCTPLPGVSVGRLAHFRVLKMLGCGGMGGVYLAHDEGLDRRVALKVMLPDAAADPAARERFLREARAAAGVKHDNVVTIYHVGEDQGVPFIAMEFLSGTPLDRYLARKGQLTVGQILRVGQETAEGLAAAHAHGLIHRDIKPGNLWLEAPKGRVKILDFGIARRLSDEPAAALTGTGTVVGTPGYMSPEQARGRLLDHRSDLFSLGVVLYQLATGRPPFEGDTTMAVLTALAVDDPVPVRRLNPAVPAELEQVIHRLLAKNPAARPISATALAEELRELAEGRTVPLAVPVELIPAAATEAPAPAGADTLLGQRTEAAFEGLGDDPVEPQPVHARTDPRGKASGRRGPFGIWAAVSLTLVVATGMVTGTVYALRKPTAVAEAAPADHKPAVPPAKPAPPKAGPPVPAPPANPITFGNPLSKQEFEELLPRYLMHEPVTEAEMVRLRETPVAGFIHIATLDDAGIEKMSRLPLAETLTKLELIAPTMTNAGFATLERFRSLQSLVVLGGCEVTDEGLKALAALPHLRVLQLPNFKLTDKAGPHLAGLTRLTDLNLSYTKIGDDGVKGLRGLTELAALNLEGTAVTDAGLPALHGSRLGLVNLKRTNTTPKALGEFSNSLAPGSVVAGDQVKP